MPEISGSLSASVKKHPCILCSQRKIKCDRNQPCANCKRSGSECLSLSTLPARKRKKRFAEAELLARLRKYEHHLRNYGADIEAINSEPSIPPETPNTKLSPPSSLSGSGDVKSISQTTLSVRRALRHVKRWLHSPLYFPSSDKYM